MKIVSTFNCLWSDRPTDSVDEDMGKKKALEKGTHSVAKCTIGFARLYCEKL